MAINNTYVNQALFEIKTVDSDIALLQKRLLADDLHPAQRKLNERIILSAKTAKVALNIALEIHYITQIDINQVMLEAQ